MLDGAVDRFEFAEGVVEREVADPSAVAEVPLGAVDRHLADGQQPIVDLDVARRVEAERELLGGDAADLQVRVGADRDRGRIGPEVLEEVGDLHPVGHELVAHGGAHEERVAELRVDGRGERDRVAVAVDGVYSV
ncbi:hypothetical protein GCM10025870_27350 [Agromyces marinus]|uniref:Uncharacterized protein n=1 Tax=Agromyces marinus TaxID=1389020 RepID=A0ABN6YDZ2_9MICO|nr:hypothetical protein GCM10025870_27350 [Agromyces marinus]